MKDVIDLYLNKEFPKKWQDKIEGFANAVVGDTDEKHKFGRAMFFIGMNIKEIRKDMGIEVGDDSDKITYYFGVEKAGK